MTRIILDSNFLRRGHFNSSRLHGLANSVGGDVEFVVPEVVVWEWAEHAASAYEALVDQHGDFPVDPSLYALPIMPTTIPKSDLVAQIEASFPTRVTVWRAPSTELRSAIQAQVLQTGTGERKDGVKTGAADHLVLACVRAQVEDRTNAEAVVLATGDKHLRQTCKAEFDDEVLLAGSHHELLARLVEFKPAPQELAETVEEQLAKRIRSATSDIGAALATFEMGFEVVSRTESTRHATRELARLGRVDIVELHDLEVGDFGGGARVGYAAVRIFADVHMSVLELNEQDGGGVGWVQTYAGNVGGGMIDLSLNVTFDRDWNLLSVASGGVARINFNQGDDDDEDEAEGLALTLAPTPDIEDARE